jgi:peptide/nickel transport system permease protein
MAFPDGYYLSKNLAVVSDPYFTTPAAVQAWSWSSLPQGATGLFISHSTTPFLSNSTGGSLQIVYTGTGPRNVTLGYTFRFPYHGPPFSFIDSIAMRVAQINDTVLARLFVTRGSDDFTLNTLNATNTTPRALWTQAQNQTIKQTGVKTNLSAAQILFSSVGNYTFGVELAFRGPAQVNIGWLQLQLYGTAYGLLGTDTLGHDMWSQDVFGSRVSLFVGLVATAIGIGLGLVVGLLAGFLGKLVDEVLMRFTDMMLVIPTLPLLIVLVAVLGQTLTNVIVIIGFLGWMGFARVIRSQVLTIRERPFVEAAKAAGSGNLRIIARHIFPNIVSLTYVNLALSVPVAILTETALAFIGLSDPSVVSWGNVYHNAENAGVFNLRPPPWWWLIPPGIGISLLALSFILIGFALDEIFNPRLRRRR